MLLSADTDSASLQNNLGLTVHHVTTTVSYEKCFFPALFTSLAEFSGKFV